MGTLHSAPGQESQPPREVSAEAVLAQLSQVTASRTFENTPVLRQLLDHLVTRAVSGQTDQLKEYSLGLDVFGRGSSFDPRVDTIVRVQARRLRTKLAEYYDHEGGRDHVLIDLPKGHYVPAFRTREDPARGDESSKAVGTRPVSRWWFGLAAGLLIGAALMFVLRGARDSTADEVAGAAAAVSLPRVTNVLVRPFENHTGTASMDAIGRRVAEQVTAGIATIDDVAVGSRPAAASIDADLNADLVVSGAYYGDAEALEFHARIVEARSGRLLHGFTIKAPSTSDLTAALESVRQSVAGAVAVHQDDFFGGLDVISYPPTLEAYREYRAGLELFQSDYTRAFVHLQRARDLAPDFLMPCVVMMFAHGNLGQPEKSEILLAAMQERSDHQTRAERLLVEFMGSSRQGRREQARRLLEELERLAPASLLVNHNLVDQYLVANRPRAAVAAYMRKPFVGKNLRHSVGSYRRWRFLQALHMLGEYDRELEESRRAQADTPGVLTFVEAELRALAALGRPAEVDDIVERSQSLPRTTGWFETPGDLMERTASELRAHSHPRESAAMAAKAIDWYRGRPAQAGGQPRHREGLARTLYLAGNWADSLALFDALAAEYPADLEYRAWLAQIAAHTGDGSRARSISDELERATRPTHRGWMTYARANIAAALGERERAVELLREAFTEGLPHGPHLHQNADLAILADYEPYRRLLQRVE